jgi:hypothetical protein
VKPTIRTLWRSLWPIIIDLWVASLLLLFIAIRVIGSNRFPRGTLWRFWGQSNRRMRNCSGETDWPLEGSAGIGNKGWLFE